VPDLQGVKSWTALRVKSSEPCDGGAEASPAPVAKALEQVLATADSHAAVAASKTQAPSVQAVEAAALPAALAALAAAAADRQHPR
jgi:hypothetical protein